jgi:hypothetical protein
MALFSCEGRMNMRFLKRTLWLIPIMAAALITTSCDGLLSVEPLATDSNTVFDPDLLGVWATVQDDDYNAIVSIREGNDHSYEIHWLAVKSGDDYKLNGRLVEINGQRILDVTPNDSQTFSIPGHAFVYISAAQDELQIQFLDSEWLQEQVKKSSLLPHYEVEGSPVITGTSAQLQNFISEFGTNEQARSEPALLRRLK